MSRWETRKYRGDGSWWIAEARDDSSRTVTTYDESGGVVASRPYTSEEADEADDRLALATRLDDHESRIVRIEAHLWPAPPDPTEPTDAPTWDDLAEPNRWPNGGLLLDTDGNVYRNISGSILTTPPSGFPGGGAAWLGNLFVVALDPDPEPTTPDGYVGPWSAQATYAVGDVVDRDGRYYRCLVAHGAERQGTWGPGPATPTIWTDLGPV